MTQISRYTLLKKVGSGVAGALYHARDTARGSLVSLRVVQLGLLDDISSRQIDYRLQRDVPALARLTHPGIGRVFEIHREGRTLLIASELIEGPTITAYVAAQPTDVSKAVTALLQLLEALEYGHSRSAIHRNLKPANIRVQGAQIRVLDFGLADLAAGDSPGAESSGDGSEYMAPEQLLNGPMDHRCDLHAAGTIFYELLTGKCPFAPDPPRLTSVSKVLEWVPPPPSQVKSGLPPVFDALLARALAKSPAQRFASAGEFGDAVSQALAALMRPVPTISPPSRERARVAPGSASSEAAGPRSTAKRAGLGETAPLPESASAALRGADAPPPPGVMAAAAPAEDAFRSGNTLPGARKAATPAEAAGTVLLIPKPAATAVPKGESKTRRGASVSERPPAATPARESVDKAALAEPAAKAASRPAAADVKPPAAPEKASEGPLPGGTVLARPKPPVAAVTAIDQLAANESAADSPGAAPAAREGVVPLPGGTVLAKPASPPVAAPSPAPPPPAHEPIAAEPRDGDTIWIPVPQDLDEVLRAMPAAPAPPVATPAEPAPRAASPLAKPAPALTEATVAHAGRVLAKFVGPIASVFSRRAAQAAKDERAYFELLAGHLGDSAERSRFLREVRRRP
jgi:eukaryotic-like serine/threonine-protein kinase